MTKLPARALGCALSFALLSGCNTGAPPPVPTLELPPPAAAAVPTNAGNLVGNDGNGVQPNFPPPNLVPSVFGGATVNGAALAGADVTIYRLGDPKPVGTGKTNEQGQFYMELGAQVPAGLALKVVATKGEQRLAAVGVASMVAAGGGNMVAAGGGNMVAAGGGNMVAAGGGNMVAAGGGNMVAAGGGNYVVAQATAAPTATSSAAPGAAERNAFVQLSLASTLAVVLLAPRLEAAGDASSGAGNAVIAQAVVEMLAAFDQMVAAAATAIAADPNLGSIASDALDAATGTATLDAAAAAQLIANAGLATAFTAAAERLGDAITAGIDAGGLRPADENLAAITLGGITIPAIRLPDVIPSERDPDPTPSATGGSSGGGSSGADGSDDEDPDAPGTVGLSGNLEQPTYQPSTAP